MSQIPPKPRLVTAVLLAGALLLAAPSSALAQDPAEAEDGQWGGPNAVSSHDEAARSFVAAVLGPGSTSPDPEELTFFYSDEDSFEATLSPAGPPTELTIEEWGCILDLAEGGANHFFGADYSQNDTSEFQIAIDSTGECIEADDDNGNGNGDDNGNGNGDDNGNGNGDDDTTGGGGTVGNGGAEDDDTIHPAVAVEVERAARVDTGRAPVPGAAVLVLALAGLVLTGLLMRRKRAR